MLRTILTHMQEGSWLWKATTPPYIWMMSHAEDRARAKAASGVSWDICMIADPILTHHTLTLFAPKETAAARKRYPSHNRHHAHSDVKQAGSLWDQGCVILSRISVRSFSAML